MSTFQRHCPPYRLHVFLAILALLLTTGNGSAAVSVSGDASPFPWFYGNVATIGNTGDGTLAIDGGSRLESWNVTFGNSVGGAGSATVSGFESHWTNSGVIRVGLDGIGQLTVEEGGRITTGSLYAAIADLHGDGVINATDGAVLDGDMRFDASYGTDAIIGFGAGGTLIVNAGAEESNASLGVGYRDSGSMTVADGVAIFSYRGLIGYRPGANGVATINGIGTTWTVDSGVGVGVGGNGSLRVEAGGKVKSFSGTIAESSGTTGLTTVNGSGSVWEAESVIVVGYSGSGALRVENGGKVISEQGTLGFDPNGIGEATITGTGSQWKVDYVDLKIGAFGHGALRVEAGGVVDSYLGEIGFGTTGYGDVSVTGAGSHWRNTTLIRVGHGGSGTLTVSNGGAVTTGYLYASVDDLYGDGAIIAQGAVLDGDLRFDSTQGNLAVAKFGSGGLLTVGAGTSNAHVLGAGYKGSGSLSVTDGAAVASTYGDIGMNSTARGLATVTGKGSKWTIGQVLNIGVSGEGTMRVEDGGRVVNLRYGSLGLNSGASGEAIVTGIGSQWTNARDFYIGNLGNGVLRVEAGGKFSCASGRLAYKPGSTAVTTVTGALSTMTMNNLGVGDAGEATLRIEAGGTVRTTSGYLAYDARSKGEATITGIGSHWANVEGLTVGCWGDATLYITDGGLVSAGGSLRISPYGSGSGFINMKTGGMLAVRGNADDSLTQFLGLVAGAGAIRYWEDAIADWAPLATANMGSDYSLTFLTSGELAGFTLLTVGSLLPAAAGDFNGDGDVDGSDFLLWQRGGSPNPLSASDLAEWKAHFAPTSLSSFAKVPEPATGILMSVSAIAFRRRRSR